VSAVDGTLTKRLEERALWVRRTVLEAIAERRKGHIGGTYSCVDLLVALYYGGILRFDSAQPAWLDRDRFLIGKGHACLALYAILMDQGFIARERFGEYGVDGGSLGGQLDIRTPGVEYNTGSLGHVLGIGAGIALAAKLDGRDYRAVVMVGDAECYEGSIWEALAFAGQHQLDGLIAIIDRNRLSVMDLLGDDALFAGFGAKVTAFGWDYDEIDGHSFSSILEAFDGDRSTRPRMILANTIKGKGISFMENGVKWHHGVPNERELAVARRELGISE